MTFAEWLNRCSLAFPNLSAKNCRPTSPTDDGYNCIAWAADDVGRWWWPDPLQQYFWPPNIPRAQTIDAFITAFESLGYNEISDATLEFGKQKIAIFVSALQIPTHAARQLPDGWWASKLGRQIDVEHELLALEGPEYGTVAIVCARNPIGTASN